jgi:4,5-dihydroxyphthalate decarboxylase
MSARLPLTLTVGRYDRVQALFDGRVRAEGIDLTCLALGAEETFFRMLRHREFDVAEMSLSSYVLSLLTPERPFVAIPVFPSRVFRHSSIYVNADSGIERPGDLRGKVVGTPEYQITAGVWIRGILAEHHGVPVDSVRYRTGGQHQANRPEKLALALPPQIDVQPIGPGQTLSAMLDSGDIDAFYTARMPDSFRRPGSRVRRLFADCEQVERDYYAATQIFPIMHTVVLRREVYERHPWVAQTLTQAFAAAQRDTYERLYDTTALATMLPWAVAELERTRELMGHDYWPYGVEANHTTL